MRPLYLSQGRRGRCPHRPAVSVRCLFRRAVIYAAFGGCVGHAYIRAGARSDLHPVRRSDLQTSSGRCRHRPLRMHESVCSSLMPGCSVCVLMRTRQDTTGGMRPLYLPASCRGRCPHRPAVPARCLFRRAAVHHKFKYYMISCSLLLTAGVRWTPLPQAEAPTDPAGETLSAKRTGGCRCLRCSIQKIRDEPKNTRRALIFSVRVCYTESRIRGREER